MLKTESVVQRDTVNMEISIVLVTCDRAEQMRVAVRSLLAQGMDPCWKFELVVVDDGSCDDTPEVLQELRANSPVPMRVLRTVGMGVPGARNLGAAAAVGRWMACFDDDQIASPDWLQNLRRAAEKTGSRCVGGALDLLLPEGANASLATRTRAILGEHLLGGRLRPYPRRWVPASNNVLIDLELFHAVGGFDERFVQGGSDTDLFRRMQDAGEPIWFAPEAQAQHVIPAQRLRPEYLRWTSLKVGAASARILARRRGVAVRTLAAVTRCGLALLRDLPALCVARAAGSRKRTLEARCSLWYTEGLLRGLTAGWAPQVFGGDRFLETLNFRRHGGERRSVSQARAGIV